ncbi:hypothetical protein ONS95_000435 [Cadophora gregata]|uniref:uncharacterized protein n=1 Tax=Cadophora gregata TaxID=51156 RepID=UPI0026DAEF1C|nr:uncharacterized protein ONS95_000435 [Cadophora gregata]KAK0125558.1 hypothetical protein ONS96_009394 [Cadophora gregata f. sp. sojae]KAK0128463.1 hypothetical protein ONS95_000435 [Cadophora gregata]
MAARKVDLDLEHRNDGTIGAAAMQTTTFKKTSFFNFENPGFLLIIYNFIFALPLSYALTLFNKYIISYVGYEKIMRCPSGIFFSRLLFVAVNMWLVVAWGIQLEREAWQRKGKRVEVLRGMVGWWEEEVKRLEDVREEVEENAQRQVEDQILSESPIPAGEYETMTPGHYGRGRDKSRFATPATPHYRANAKEADEHGCEAGDAEDDEDDEESEESEESSEEDDDEEDSDWNGDD